jgi:hypothetical protein
LKSSELGPFCSEKSFVGAKSIFLGYKRVKICPGGKKKTKKFHDDQSPNFLTQKKKTKPGRR